MDMRCSGNLSPGEPSEEFLSSFKGQLSHYSESDWKFIDGAHTFATRAHSGQNRYDNGPYIRHPEETVRILFEVYDAQDISSMDIATLLCHDVIEDCPNFREELYKYSTELFWRVAALSELAKPEVSKYLIRKRVEDIFVNLFGGYQFSASCMMLIWWYNTHVFMNMELCTQQSQQDFADGKKWIKLIQVLSMNQRTLLLKACDRIHNLRDIEHIPQEKLHGLRKNIKQAQYVLVPCLQNCGLRRVADILMEAASCAQKYCDAQLKKS